MAAYQWVFSGIGVLALSTGLNFLRRGLKKDAKVSGDKSFSAAAQSSEAAANSQQVQGGNFGVIAGRDVVQHHHYTQPAAPPQQPSSSPDVAVRSDEAYSATPTVEEIVDTIRAAPPYQRSAVAAGYIGLQIAWHLEFRGIQNIPSSLLLPEAKPSVRVLIMAAIGSERRREGVTVLADFDEFLRMRTLHEGSAVTIHGRIITMMDVTPLVVAEDIRFD